MRAISTIRDPKRVSMVRLLSLPVMLFMSSTPLVQKKASAILAAGELI